MRAGKDIPSDDLSCPFKLLGFKDTAPSGHTPFPRRQTNLKAVWEPSPEESQAGVRAARRQLPEARVQRPPPRVQDPVCSPARRTPRIAPHPARRTPGPPAPRTCGRGARPWFRKSPQTRAARPGGPAEGSARAGLGSLRVHPREVAGLMMG